MIDFAIRFRCGRARRRYRFVSKPFIVSNDFPPHGHRTLPRPANPWIPGFHERSRQSNQQRYRCRCEHCVNPIGKPPHEIGVAQDRRERRSSDDQAITLCGSARQSNVLFGHCVAAERASRVLSVGFPVWKYYLTRTDCFPPIVRVLAGSRPLIWDGPGGFVASAASL